MNTEQGIPHRPALDGGREGPGDATPLPGAGGTPEGSGGAGGAAGAGQSAEPVWRYQVPPPGGAAGAGASNAGHYTPNAAGHGGGIVEAPAESNVNAAGRPLSGAGSATDPAPGTIGGIEASRKARESSGPVEGDPAASASAGTADSNLSGSGGTDRS